MADAAILLAGGLAALYCRLGARSDRSVRVRWEDLVRRYPDLDRELDLIWQRHGRCRPHVWAGAMRTGPHPLPALARPRRRVPQAATDTDKTDIMEQFVLPYPLNRRGLERTSGMPLTKEEEEEVLVTAGREFLGPLYYRHTGGGAVFGDSMDIDWITKDGVIVATGTNWPAEIQILVPWGHKAVLQGAAARELFGCGIGPWTGGEVRRYAKPHVILGGGGAYRWKRELDEELVTAALCGDAEEIRRYLRNHINVVAVVLDNVKLGPVVTYELLAELGRSGFAGKAYRMSDGDEELRAGLGDYLLADAAAA